MHNDTHILHRQTQSKLPVASYGDGPYVVDSNGKRYLDACGGAAVSCLGYSHPRVTQAIKDQLDKLAFAHSAFFTSEPAEQLADFLVQRAPEGIEHVYFVSGGSEAIESALKLARQYHLEKGEPQRRTFIARRQSYHGNTLGALAVGGNKARREAYGPLLMDIEHISPCYQYRNQGADESVEDYGLRAANELDSRLQQIGAENVIAFVAETVGGATAGVLVPTPGYWKRIREICDKHGILLILDEVMCGMGRTGSLFACEQEALRPDIVAVAKALGAGYQPIGAMLCSHDIFEAVRTGSGSFKHGHTYLSHSTACAAALAVQESIEEENLLQNVCEKGEELQQALNQRFSNHPAIGDIRGRGLFWGIELVSNKKTKQPFSPDLKIDQLIKHHAMEQCLMCYPGSGTVDGLRGNHILLAPPFIISSDQVREIVEKLAKAIDGAFTELGLKESISR
ncbi:MAG: aspartate aminotransferase family protein [SAR86 cluster bacterium]|uniref:Aspartate aminotransferase family protein n=1 Tax=SAR86 cluster bacterium TaxID=2030880 RepID=A0A2A4XIS1_9GAMM|nr:MAG: aspartate aminotransferase family protein [SAR86 cluster bacterium]